MESVLAKSTTSTYATGNRQYIKFCTLHSITDPYPAREDYVLGFITYLHMHGKKPSTIHVYLYAIRYHQLYTHNTDPLKHRHKIESMIKAIKRISNPNKQQRIPITIPILTLIRPLLDFNMYDHQVLWAALVLGVYGLLRTSELVQADTNKHSIDDSRLLLVNNIKLISPLHFILNLKASKTDPYRLGADIHYFANNTPTCPIAALTPILDHHKGDACQPLFALSDGKPLTSKRLIQYIRVLIKSVELEHQLGLDHNNFSGYSLRRGGATSLYAAGMSETTIKTMGRWRSYCFRLYVETPLYVLKDAQTCMSALSHRPQQSHVLPAFWDIESHPIV